VLTPRKPCKYKDSTTSDLDVYLAQGFIRLTKTFNKNTLSTFFSLIIMYSNLFYI
jgi:hypothetical protein